MKTDLAKVKGTNSMPPIFRPRVVSGGLCRKHEASNDLDYPKD